MKPLRIIFHRTAGKDRLLSVAFDNGKCYNVDRFSFASRLFFKLRTGYCVKSILQNNKYLMFNTENDVLSVTGG